MTHPDDLSLVQAELNRQVGHGRAPSRPLALAALSGGLAALG